MKKKKCIMIQGTRAGIGKSLITLGVARLLANNGYQTQVFKSQAMEDKMYRVPSGGFIPPSMACAAQGTGHEAQQRHVPVYLKPVSDLGAAVDNFSIDQEYEVYVMGEFQGVMLLSEYLKRCREYYTVVRESLHSLLEESDALVIEGAGCPTELTPLGDGLANAIIAEECDAEVWMVSDLILGGAFAAAAGTLQLLSNKEKERIKGVIFNKALSASDVDFLKPSVTKFEELTGVPAIAVMPLMPDLEHVNKVLKFKRETPSGEWLWNDTYDYWTEHLANYLAPQFQDGLKK